MTTDRAHLLAIDPGGAHVGIAWFHELDPPTTWPGWECYHTTELTPAGLGDLLEIIHQDPPDILVYEEFRLYPDKALALTGSHIETAECIGVIKHCAAKAGIEPTAQPAAYQQTALGLLQARGMRSTAKRTKSGPHALSAELHGWAYLWRNQLVPDEPPF